PIEGVNTGVLYEQILQRSSSGGSAPETDFIYYVTDREKLIQKIKEELREGDILLTMGAGDVWKIGEEVLKELKNNG
ncbi:MAG: hypothetical protein N2257_02980, partial [Thermodesulfovibrionales bacterium]|nr:hypothetical protein [Thermodesulfovibrionales bacterium]